MRREKYRVGLVGAGIIADARVPALRAAGLEVTTLGTRARSTRVHDFAARHEITQVFEDWEAMLKEPGLWDALVVSTWPDGTPEVIEAALGLNVPILVEKPVAWNTARLARLCARPHDQVIVGYNRRYYASVQSARREARQGPPLLAQLTMPTDVVVPDEYDPTGRYMQQFYESVSALGLDLTRFVLGDLRVEAVRRVKNRAGNIAGLTAILATDRGDLLHLTSNWDAPANYMLTLSRPGRRFELLPFEIGHAYEGMEVILPSADYPIRRYTPKLVERIALDGVDLQQKPGFVGEARTLRAMIDGEAPPEFTARLEDALAVTRLCEELTGVVLSDTNPSTYH